MVENGDDLPDKCLKPPLGVFKLFINNDCRSKRTAEFVILPSSSFEGADVPKQYVEVFVRN